MTGVISSVQTGDQDIDGLLTGSQWDSRTLTYSFPAQASFYGPVYGWGETRNNFEALNPVQIAMARKAFDMMSSVTGLNFVETTETAVSHATLRLAMSDRPTPAWTYIPGTTEEGGDTWFGNSSQWYDAPVRGNYAFYAFLHEMGHAVGLKHGDDVDGAFGAMTPAHDSMEYSVMTYRSYVGASNQYVQNETWGYAQTPMMDDIAALQHMYGANFTTNGGNTIYRWNPATGEVSVNGAGQGAPGGNRVFMTLWDGGGVDTYDFSPYTGALTVDLRPGQWSTTSPGQIPLLGDGHLAHGNIANALLCRGDLRSLIENAVGGSGNDRITGNSAVNNIKGLGGADVINGREGGDTLTGGSGSDTLTGGSGKDIFLMESKLGKSTNLDRITDFNVADDTIYLENAIFTKVGSGGTISTQALWIGTKAHDASDRVIYDSKSGALFYDGDGTGSGAAVQFATLSASLKVTAGDFFVV